MTGKHQVTNGTVILVNGDIYKVIVVSDLLSKKSFYSQVENLIQVQ